MIRRFLLWAVDQYQRAAEGRPSPCRFFPSCSEYAKEALAVHGTGRGSWLTLRRLARCRPFGPSGFDPVPEPHRSHCCDAVTGSPELVPEPRPEPLMKVS